MIEELSRVRDAKPFKLFDISLVDGRRFLIPHPEFLFAPPSARRTFVVGFEDESYQVLDLMLVTCLDFLNGKVRLTAAAKIEYTLGTFCH